ncbi:hypothetical protein ACE193_11355 [Bernardetia sp. OM2101]|uniref:hypothetical protein n=1 Tax=Bernardetia sp. OM2101 TaxID=3344876 RepID=UPI0035CF65C2
MKDIYPFHRFGMFAEPIKYQAQYEKFYIFYKKETDSNFTELRPQNIPLNANAFEMQLRKHHYQQKHTDFINVFDEIIRNKINLKENLKSGKKLNWKWYHVIQKQNSDNKNNKLDSLCVFSN